VGIVLRPWGTRGEVKVALDTDFPERFASLRRVFIEGRAIQVEGVRWHKGQALVKLAGIDSPEEARPLSGKELEIPVEEAAPLAEGQYYLYQIMGLEVWTTEGTLVGRVEEVLRIPSNDVYVVVGPRGQSLIPAVAEIVKAVDLEAGRITIEALDGLLD
jgi:16S rRNA processing protein RimM